MPKPIHAPCIGGHNDGTWITGDTNTLAVPVMPQTTIATLEGEYGVMVVDYYKRMEMSAGGEIFTLWIKDDMSNADAFRALVNGYRRSTATARR